MLPHSPKPNVASTLEAQQHTTTATKSMQTVQWTNKSVACDGVRACTLCVTAESLSLHFPADSRVKCVLRAQFVLELFFFCYLR